MLYCQVHLPVQTGSTTCSQQVTPFWHNLHDNCRPEAFGQHQNAEISYLIEDSKVLLGGLLSLVPKAGGVGAAAPTGRREELVEAVANDLLDQVST